ncbi:MAG: hypothetical protein HDS38_06855 [Bacteroides sp.]|nr:hypothetical protein [Bacteroides sp.]
MRKITIFILSLFSALFMWAENNDTPDYNSTLTQIENLKNKQSEVIESAKNATSINDSDIATANSTLNYTFCSLDSVLRQYNYINNAELQRECLIEISKFIKDYKKAILNRDGTKITIGSNRFLTVAKDYKPKFEELNNKILKLLSTNLESIHPAQIPEEPYSVKDSIANIQDKVATLEKKSSLHSTWTWFSLVIGILGLIAGCFALYCISKINSTNSKRREKIKDVESRIQAQINDLKTSINNVPVAKTYAPSKPYQPKRSGRNRSTPKDSYPDLQTPKDNIPEQPAYGEETAYNPETTKPKISTYNLFATIKVGSPLPEFSKVTSEHTGDKVFMLTLDSPESDVAEFTIAPNMAQDFMKSIISDRDTYLPNVFCEKSIESHNPTNIEVISQGVAKKVDGKWHVQHRMSIRLV